jgi:hypothetical protein
LLPHLKNLDTNERPPAQLADPSIPSVSESQLLSEYYAEITPCVDQGTAAVVRLVPEYQSRATQSRSDAEATWSALIGRQISWGEAARRWQQVDDATKAWWRAST